VTYRNAYKAPLYSLDTMLGQPQSHCGLVVVIKIPSRVSNPGYLFSSDSSADTLLRLSRPTCDVERLSAGGSM